MDSIGALFLPESPDEPGYRSKIFFKTLTGHQRQPGTSQSTDLLIT